MTARPAPLQGLEFARVVSLAPAPDLADIERAAGVCPVGQGHDATTKLKRVVVGLVVGFLPARSRGYCVPRRHDRKNHPLHICAHAQAHTIGICLSWRRGVVAYSNSLKIKNKDHDKGHDSPLAACRGLVKCLINLEKVGFCHG